MTYTFSFAVKKFGASDVGRVKNHNLRAHPTSSQLRPEAWFTRLGHSSFVLWDDAKITQAKVLSTRKDAVVAIGFSLQLGAQTDWRSPPSESFPEGQPLPLTEARKQVLRNLREAAKVWAIEEFGESNLVSVDLHNDESTPHVQVVVTPIFDGKLQAKHWLNGGSTCAALRRRACDVMNRFVECTYVPGNPGGEPHDPGLSAGAKPAPGISKSREEELEQENAELKARVRALEQSLFSRSKSHYTKAVIEKSKQEAKSAIAAAEAAKKSEMEARKELKAVQDKAVRDVNDGQSRINELERKITSFQGNIDSLQLSALEWRTKYQIEIVNKNNLASELAAKETEINELKRKYVPTKTGLGF